MKIRDALIRGYYDEMNGKDYIVDINTNVLKEWIFQKKPDLLDFETKMEKKIELYKLLEKELTKNLSHYNNFTVNFI